MRKVRPRKGYPCRCGCGVRNMNEVAKLMGCSRERVRQLLMSALAKLRTCERLREWADYHIKAQKEIDQPPEIGIGA